MRFVVGLASLAMALSAWCWHFALTGATLPDQVLAQHTLLALTGPSTDLSAGAAHHDPTAGPTGLSVLTVTADGLSTDDSDTDDQGTDRQPVEGWLEPGLPPRLPAATRVGTGPVTTVVTAPAWSPLAQRAPPAQLV